MMRLINREETRKEVNDRGERPKWEEFHGWADTWEGEGSYPPAEWDTTINYTGHLTDEMVGTPFSITLAMRATDQSRVGGWHTGLRLGHIDNFRDNPEDLTENERQYIAGCLRGLADAYDLKSLREEANPFD